MKPLLALRIDYFCLGMVASVIMNQIVADGAIKPLQFVCFGIIVLITWLNEKRLKQAE